jgi:hypothetical protein
MDKTVKYTGLAVVYTYTDALLLKLKLVHLINTHLVEDIAQY